MDETQIFKDEIRESMSDIAKLKSDVVLLNTDVAGLKRDTQKIKNKNAADIVKLTSLLIRKEVIESDNIIHGVSQSDTTLVCENTWGAPDSIKIILDDFTITKTKGDLFRFRRQGTDYYTINILRRAKVAFTSAIKFSVDIKSDIFLNAEDLGFSTTLILGRGLKESEILLSTAFDMWSNWGGYINQVSLSGDIDVNSRDSLVLYFKLTAVCTGTISKDSEFTMYEL